MPARTSSSPSLLSFPPTDLPSHSSWLMFHIMEDYRFTGNTSFLASWYPTMKASAQFFVDFMTPYDEYIVTNPTLSPENRYYGEQSMMNGGRRREIEEGWIGD